MQLNRNDRPLGTCHRCVQRSLLVLVIKVIELQPWAQRNVLVLVLVLRQQRLRESLPAMAPLELKRKTGSARRRSGASPATSALFCQPTPHWSSGGREAANCQEGLCHRLWRSHLGDTATPSRRRTKATTGPREARTKLGTCTPPLHKTSVQHMQVCAAWLAMVCFALVHTDRTARRNRDR